LLDIEPVTEGNIYKFERDKMTKVSDQVLIESIPL
jgi:hypothetical protein